MKYTLIEDIIHHEWQFFTTTINKGRRAPCQDQKGNFLASRRSYWNMYSNVVLKSYLEDLKWALIHKQNLVTLKYAYMMKYTDPNEYIELKTLLPEITKKKSSLIKSIMQIYMTWESEIAHNHPSLDNHNRPLYQSEDTKISTSVETYMTGERTSYSEETLMRILSYFVQLQSNKENPIIIYLKQLTEY